MYQELEAAARQAVLELLEVSKIKPGEILVVGCSTSEVLGERIGTGSNKEVADAILAGILPPVKERGVWLAAQCCEHLNRALILEAEAARQYRLEQVNAVPQPKAGGSFATAAYEAMAHPVAVEQMQAARAGMDIGNTLIGMHMARVAVPVRLAVKRIGQAPLVCARVRPKYIGGVRAHYDENLL